MSARRKPLEDWRARFWKRVEKQDTQPFCWTWKGCLSTKGYAQVRINNRLWTVHRLAYEMLVGPIPPGLVVDHLCRNRACCNPVHLEPVTSRENTLRGEVSRRTHCPQGHAYTAENTYRWRTYRYCRQCHGVYSRRWTAKQKSVLT